MTNLLFCQCETHVIDVEHDEGCRRCGRPVDFTPRMYRVWLGADMRPHTAFTCKHCATLALSKVPGASASPLDRVNLSYACDLRYEGCQHSEGIRR
jgi:hypothetical protein